MRSKTACRNFAENFAAPAIRTRVLALIGGKVIGLALVMTTMYVWLGPSLHALLGEPEGAFFIGVIGAIVMIWGIDALEYLRIDDPIGAVPVHMVGGIWSTLSLGFFATGQHGWPTPTGADVSVPITGLLYGGGAAQLIAQVIGSGATVVATLAASVVLTYSV